MKVDRIDWIRHTAEAPGRRFLSCIPWCSVTTFSILSHTLTQWRPSTVNSVLGLVWAKYDTRWVSCEVYQTNSRSDQHLSQQLGDEYFTGKCPQNIKGSKFQCPEVRQAQSRKPEHPWQRTSGTGNKEKQSVYGLYDKPAQYSWKTCLCKKLNSVCLWKR